MLKRSGRSGIFDHNQIIVLPLETGREEVRGADDQLAIIAARDAT
jgi:hypothetical protein